MKKTRTTRLADRKTGSSQTDSAPARSSATARPVSEPLARNSDSTDNLLRLQKSAGNRAALRAVRRNVQRSGPDMILNDAEAEPSFMGDREEPHRLDSETGSGSGHPDVHSHQPNRAAGLAPASPARPGSERQAVQMFGFKLNDWEAIEQDVDDVDETNRIQYSITDIEEEVADLRRSGQPDDDPKLASAFEKLTRARRLRSLSWLGMETLYISGDVTPGLGNAPANIEGHTAQQFVDTLREIGYNLGRHGGAIEFTSPGADLDRTGEGTFAEQVRALIKDIPLSFTLDKTSDREVSGPQEPKGLPPEAEGDPLATARYVVSRANRQSKIWNDFIDNVVKERLSNALELEGDEPGSDEYFDRRNSELKSVEEQISVERDRQYNELGEIYGEVKSATTNIGFDERLVFNLRETMEAIETSAKRWLSLVTAWQTQGTGPESEVEMMLQTSQESKELLDEQEQERNDLLESLLQEPKQDVPNNSNPF